LESRLSGPLNPTQADYLAGISEASQTLATLIDSILDVSLGEAGQWDTVATNIALAPVINSVAAVVRPQMEAQGLTLEMSIAADVPTIQADERRLRQLVFNMMSCAVRHNRPGSRVDLNCTVNAGQVELAVGLQADGRLFDHRAIENELGLTLVQRLTALHGGRMLVQQQSDTSIALVCTLPRHRPPS
jgi:signal transduction histidine kinase